MFLGPGSDPETEGAEGSLGKKGFSARRLAVVERARAAGRRAAERSRVLARKTEDIVNVM